MLAAHYAASNSLSSFEEVRIKACREDNASNAICDIALIQQDGKTLVKISQYVFGLTGAHADQLGYLVTALSWNEAGSYSEEDMHFVSSPGKAQKKPPKTPQCGFFGGIIFGFVVLTQLLRSPENRRKPPACRPSAPRGLPRLQDFQYKPCLPPKAC